MELSQFEISCLLCSSLPFVILVIASLGIWSLGLGLVPLLTVKTAHKYKISVTSQYSNKFDMWYFYNQTCQMI